MRSVTAPEPTSTTDRLASLRDRAGTAGARSFRVEVLVGLLLVVGGIAFVFISGREAATQVAPADAAGADAAPVPTVEEVDRLLADEAILAVALDAGQFPPGLAVGDRVLVTVTPEFDVDTGVRTLESTPVIVGVDPPDESGTRWVVTLRGDRAVPKILAAARTVHLAIVESAR